MDPAKIAKTSEHSHQVALFAWAAQNRKYEPRLEFLYAVPNGATFGDDKKSRAIRGANMKAEGLRDGVPDVCLPVPMPDWKLTDPYGNPVRYHGLHIEMKRPDARLKRAPAHKWDTGGVSDEQVKWLNFLESQGYKCVVCYSWLEAAKAIKYYLTGDDTVT